MRETVREDSSPLRPPLGVLGAGIGLAFLLGRAFPFSHEDPRTARNASQACLAGRVGLHLLGRRTLVAAIRDERSGTGDLGLDVAHVAGLWIAGWAAAGLAATEAHPAIGGNVVGRDVIRCDVMGRDVVGDPFAVVAGLARVLPGQTLLAGVGDFGSVPLNLR